MWVSTAEIGFICINTNLPTAASSDEQTRELRKTAIAHKMLNVNKCHFKVKMFTLCDGPLKKLPIKLEKCRRVAIIAKNYLNNFSFFFTLNSNTKSNCIQLISVRCKNIGKQGDALNTVLPLRAVMQHRPIYCWKIFTFAHDFWSCTRYRNYARSTHVPFFCFCFCFISYLSFDGKFTNLPNAHRPMHVELTFSNNLKAFWFRDFYSHKIN